MLDRLYTLLLLFKEYVLLALFVFFSLFLLTLNDNRQVKQIRAVSSILFGVVQDQVSFVPRYFVLRKENDILRRRNIELSHEVNRLREAKLEATRLYGLVDLKEKGQFNYIPARVIGKNLFLSRNTLTLDAGLKDSVTLGMPVLNHDGLIGVVVSVMNHYSIVNILLNVDFRASAKIERSRVDGIIAWSGSKLLFTNVPKTQDVKPGDVVITSEYSATYPSGIRIGIVEEATAEPGTLFKKVAVKPSVDFTRLEEVFLIPPLPKDERQSPEQSTLTPNRR